VNRIKVMAVGELTAYLQNLLNRDPHLSNVWVKGEISNLRCPSSGHLYFTLKDRYAALRCVMFNSRQRLLKFALKDGLEIVARGQVAIYPRDGVYQLYVEEVFPVGTGMATLLLQELEAKLEREGLFDPRRKRPLPFLPRRIGVVTSLSGAAIRDIITVSRRRFPGIDLVIAPARVQGDKAPLELARALQALARYGKVDVIIIGRGGGSAEDLSAFNTEMVARAIFSCPVPVIAAVGHETDLTLADLVADHRAPTPSAAAAMAVPAKADLEERLGMLHRRARKGLLHRLELARNRLERLVKSRGLARPLQELRARQQYLDALEQSLSYRCRAFLQAKLRILENLTVRLEGASPLKILSRGYAVCRRPGGSPIKSSGEVGPGERVEVILHRGSLHCLVERVVGES